MKYDIITLAPTVSDAAHAAGDVMFNLTEIKLPDNACKLVNVFMEVASGGGEDDTKIGILFFRKRTTASLGTLNATANISAANFTANEYIGQVQLGLSDGGNLDLDGIDNVALYYSTNAFSTAAGTRGGNGQMDLVLKSSPKDFSSKGDSVALGNDLYVAGLIHSGAPDFDGTDNVKIHLHVEY
tara:strand:- start:220 stop:771 length:552 start_codon:yes stop_codon:yes gene_type:complete